MLQILHTIIHKLTIILISMLIFCDEEKILYSNALIWLQKPPTKTFVLKQAHNEDQDIPVLILAFGHFRL